MMILAARNGEWPPAKPKWLAAGAALKLETMPSARLKPLFPGRQRPVDGRVTVWKQLTTVR
jgi:hypothetical protein